MCRECQAKYYTMQPVLSDQQLLMIHPLIKLSILHLSHTKMKENNEGGGGGGVLFKWFEWFDFNKNCSLLFEVIFV